MRIREYPRAMPEITKEGFRVWQDGELLYDFHFPDEWAQLSFHNRGISSYLERRLERQQTTGCNSGAVSRKTDPIR